MKCVTKWGYQIINLKVNNDIEIFHQGTWKNRKKYDLYNRNFHERGSLLKVDSRINGRKKITHASHKTLWIITEKYLSSFMHRRLTTW